MDSLIKLDINDLLKCLENCNTNTPPIENAKVAFTRFINTPAGVVGPQSGTTPAGVIGPQSGTTPAPQSGTRNKSSIFQMRKFHNWVKETLIINVVNYYYRTHRENINLLDIAVGRGGDLDKWDRAMVSNVFGFDNSEDSITEAVSRSKKKKINVEFHVGNAIDPSSTLIGSLKQFINKHSTFQIVSCQFALHYFFKSKQALLNMLTLVSDCLRPGGYFIGTAIDGSKIIRLLNGSKIYNSELLSITSNFKKKMDSYGNEYTFNINDSEDKSNYFNAMGASTEYLVDFRELERVALTLKLEVVKLNFFEKKSKFEFTSLKNEIVNSFEDIYPFYGKQISSGEQEISFLNSVFVFKKL